MEIKKIRVDYRYGSTPSNKTMSRTTTTLELIDTSTMAILVILQAQHPGRKIEIISTKPLLK